LLSVLFFVCFLSAILAASRYDHAPADAQAPDSTMDCYPGGRFPERLIQCLALAKAPIAGQCLGLGCHGHDLADMVTNMASTCRSAGWRYCPGHLSDSGARPLMFHQSPHP